MTVASHEQQVLGGDDVGSNYRSSDRIVHAPSPSPEGYAVNALNASMNSNNNTHFTSDEIEELQQLLRERRHQSSAIAMPIARSTVNGAYMNETDAMRADESSHLLRDTFSFIVAARTWSLPFFTGVAVVVTKIGIYCLILADMTSNGSPGNPLGISATLEWPVAFCQTIAVAVAVISQNDLISALTSMSMGYGGIGEAFEHATFWKWFASVSLVFIAGVYGLLVTFLLVVTSSDVVELILNFTAIEFISLLDDFVFHFCSFGFFGRANRLMAKVVQETKYNQVGGQERIPWLHTCLLFLSFASMIGGLVYVFVLQLSGQFLPSSIVVQFDDDITPALSTFSGQFVLRLTDGSILDEGRVLYYNRIGEGTIGYCDDLQAWTFGRSRSDYCDDVMALSHNPTSRDISLILGKTWYAPIGGDPSRVLPMENALGVSSCSDDDDCGGSDRGICESSGCRCHEGYFGIWCNYGEHEVCDTIRLDKSESFARLEHKESSDFVVLRDQEGKLVTAYYHPVYVSSAATLNDSSVAVDLIIFAGLRWMLSSAFPPESGLQTYFNSSFHASHSLLGPIEATTEVVRFNTATDERPDPSDLSWFHPGSPDITEIMPVLGVDTFFTCSKCGTFYPCAFGNMCNGDGQCVCENGETGSFCQVLPVGDGQCNEFFNSRVFGYDGGDCCEGSCSSGATHRCGIIEEDGLDGISVGFPFCIDPVHNCGSSMKECWSWTSNIARLHSKGSSGAFVTVSGNGRTLVVSEPGLNTIRVFDQVDATWVQRGQTLVGTAKSRFGTFVSLSTLPGNVARRRMGHLPVVLAVGAVGNTTNYVEVYRFEEHGEAWSLEGQQLIFNETIDSLSIGSTGQVLSLAVGLRNTNSGYIYKQDRKLQWQLVFNTSGSMVGLSGNGQTVVCLSTIPAEGESQESGIFSLSELTIPDPYYSGAVNATLSNLLPVEMRNLTVQSRPVALQVDYAGTSCIIFGPVVSDAYGVNGFAMIGLQRNGTYFVTNRLGVVGVNISDATPELERSVVSLSSDTFFFAINLQKTQVEVFDITETPVVPESFQFLPNASDIPSFEVNGLEDSFAISDGGLVLAVVANDEVAVAHRNPFCNGTKIRLAISLDDEPGSVSWSLDYARRGDEDIADGLSDNVASCVGCYGGDIRYSRVVVVEDACIPVNKVGCVQLTFSVSGRHMGEGAGFMAFADGHPFARYDGNLDTKVFAPGDCT